MKNFTEIFFSKEDLSKEAFEVYKKSKFRFYKKKGEPEHYYVVLLRDEQVENLLKLSDIESWIKPFLLFALLPTNLFKLYNVENWLLSWIDEDGEIRVSTSDLLRSLKEEMSFKNN